MKFILTRSNLCETLGLAGGLPLLIITLPNTHTMKKSGNKRYSVKNSTHFTIDLDIKGLILFLTMVALTGVTVFYLGVIFGKASRKPDEATSSKSFSESAAVKEDELSIPKNLKIFDIKDDPQKIDTLRQNVENALKKTDTAIKQGEDQLKDRAKPAEVTKQPNTKTITSKSLNIYTIQVFVTKSKEKANLLSRQLRQKNFDSHVLEVSHQGQKLYKIRVGRKSREKIKELEKKLQKVVESMGMGLSVIKVS